MPLTTGARIGHYEVTGAIGAGGMGEVYRATDTTLKRTVALKVLPDAVAADGQRLARFQSEAEALATLNHPNIAAIYGLEKSSGVTALAMELVDGVTLEELIANAADVPAYGNQTRRRGLPLDDALRISCQIAEALEAAHDAGIVHRDLKPANIKVRPDGAVKVLDFGLAKVRGPQSASSSGVDATMTSPAVTQMGMILGTAAYMAPEQARGRQVDRRADVWAFGAVLYEMVTGERAFAGDSVTEVIASVLAREPDWSKLPADAPAMNGVIRQCLERDPRQRFGDMQSVRLALTGALRVGPGLSSSTPVVSAPAGVMRRSARTSAIPWIVAVTAIGAAAALGVPYLTRSAAETAVVKSSILPPANVAFDFDVTVGPAVISPNGKLVAFSGRDTSSRIQLWVRPLDSTDARPIAGTEGASFPFWSPDSQALGFYSAARGEIERVDLSGGAPVGIVRAGYVRGAYWTSDGAVLYDTSDGGGQIMEVPIAGGASKSLVHDQGISRSPWVLPDGRHFLYSNREKREVHVAARDGSLDKVLTTATSHAIYANGQLIFMRETTLLAQPFDAASLALTGSPTAIARDVQMLLGDARGLFSASDTGALLYVDGASTASTTLAWFDEKGTRIGTVGEIGGARGLRLSPDGRTAALGIIDADDRLNLWTVDLATNTRHQLTFTHDGQIPFEAWSPDGKTVAYGIRRDSGLAIARRASVGGAEEILFTLPAAQRQIANPRVSAWTNDGSTLIYSGSGLGGIWSLPLAPGPGQRTARSLVADTTAQNARLSPNQRWIVYQAAIDAGATLQIYVDAFPDGGRRQEVAARGTIALWGADGQSLYYADDNILTMLPVAESDGALHFGPPRAIMPIMIGRGFSYDVARDGRILALVTSEAAAARPLTLVQNWTKAAGLAR